MTLVNNFLLIGLPYAALAVFLIGTIYRYKASKFSYSSLSSQFLEGRTLFWGSMMFHWGLLFLFAGHLLALTVPRSVIAFNNHPLRLFILEISALTFAVVALVGLILLFARRVLNARLRVVTTRMDIFIELLLITEILTGIVVALSYRWGSTWFAAVLTPYLWSVATFKPDISAVVALPWLIRLHIILAYLIVLLIPFTRVAHLLVLPLHYTWRPFQRVLWNWDRKLIRNSKTKWSATPPTNT